MVSIMSDAKVASKVDNPRSRTINAKALSALMNCPLELRIFPFLSKVRVMPDNIEPVIPENIIDKNLKIMRRNSSSIGNAIFLTILLR